MSTMPLGARPTAIHRMLNPASVTVIGASEDRSKFGGRLISNLLHHGFKGTVYPINPKREVIFGHKAYPEITDVPSPPDVAVVAVPVTSLLECIRGCVEVGVKIAIVITGQLAETGEKGAKIQEEAVTMAQAAEMRILGPNCLGAFNSVSGVCLSPSVTMSVDRLRQGRVGVASQSGALQTAMFIRAFDSGIGFSSAITFGNQADLELSDGFEYLVDDPNTEAILLYVEGLKDLSRFKAAAIQARAIGKPVVAVKAGRTDAGAAMANSHTGSLTGSYQAFEALCESLGIVVTDQPDTAVFCADALARWGAPKAGGVAVASGSGGAAALVADAINDSSFHAARLSDLAVEYLSEQQPLVKDTANVDFGAYFRAFDPAVMDQTLEVFANEPDVGAMLLVMTPQPAMDSLFESIHRVGTELGVPALICNKAGSLVRNQLEAKVMETGYPVYTSLDDCYRVLETLMVYREFQNEGPRSNGRAPIKEISSTAKSMTPGLLTEPEAKSLLVAAGLPVTREIMASDLDAAVEAAGKIGFPVAIKGVARGLIHKSDADAVRLNIPDPAETRRAFSEIKNAIEGNVPDSKFHGCLVTEMVLDGVAEAFVGASWDPQHGAGILVGAGGVFVEILKDVKLAAVPVDQVKARKMIESLKMFPLFNGARGRPRADLNALVDIVCRVSFLAECLGPDLKELDINPVILRREGKGAKVVDARAVWKA